MSFTISGKSDGNVFGEMLGRLEQRQEAVRAGVQAAQKGIQHNFDTQSSGDGPWKDLHPQTVKDRAKVGLGPRPILYRGGRYPQGRKNRPTRILRQTFTDVQVDKDEGSVSSSDPRASVLDEQRPIVKLQQQDVEAVFKAMTNRLTGRD